MKKFDLWWKVIAGLALLVGLVLGGVQVYDLFTKEGWIPAILITLSILVPESFAVYFVYFKK